MSKKLLVVALLCVAVLSAACNPKYQSGRYESNGNGKFAYRQPTDPIVSRLNQGWQKVQLQTQWVASNPTPRCSHMRYPHDVVSLLFQMQGDYKQYVSSVDFQLVDLAAARDIQLRQWVAYLRDIAASKADVCRELFAEYPAQALLEVKQMHDDFKLEWHVLGLSEQEFKLEALATLKSHLGLARKAMPDKREELMSQLNFCAARLKVTWQEIGVTRAEADEYGFIEHGDGYYYRKTHKKRGLIKRVA